MQQPTYDWGALLASGLQDLNANPIEVVGPALGILITGLAAGLVGDGLNHYLDPRLRVSFRRRRRAAAAIERVALGVPSPGAAGGRAALTPGLVASVSDLRVFAPDAPEAPIVRGVSLQIRRGEIVGLVGESGSGKTMTAMGIARLLPAGLLWDAAELTVSGRDVSARSRSTRHLATEVGIVFQDPSSSFNPARHIGPQITETARVHGGMGKQQANALAIDRLRESHVSSPELRMRQYPHELSGGMRQRAMIAMALMTSPSLLIADEPTTALDVTVQADVLRLLRNLNQSHGMAVLLISHDIAVVSALCDRVLRHLRRPDRRGTVRRGPARAAGLPPLHPGAAGRLAPAGGRRGRDGADAARGPPAPAGDPHQRLLVRRPLLAGHRRVPGDRPRAARPGRGTTSSVPGHHRAARGGDVPCLTPSCTPPRCRPATAAAGIPAWSCTRSTSRCCPARPWASSASPARASRRWPRSWSASCGRRRARSPWTGRTSDRCAAPPCGPPGAGSSWCRRTRTAPSIPG